VTEGTKKEQDLLPGSLPYRSRTPKWAPWGVNSVVGRGSVPWMNITVKDKQLLGG
jgi:hypothetical protein